MPQTIIHDRQRAEGPTAIEHDPAVGAAATGAATAAPGRPGDNTTAPSDSRRYICLPCQSMLDSSTRPAEVWQYNSAVEKRRHSGERGRTAPAGEDPGCH